LKKPGSDLGKVRPTTGKVLESILATLAPFLPEARVLDLFGVHSEKLARWEGMDG
jgi:16S rRNA G966 N2-methylase RsmD